MVSDLVDDAELRAKLEAVNEREGWRSIVGGMKDPSSLEGRAAFARAKLTPAEKAAAQEAFDRFRNWPRPYSGGAGPSSRLEAGAAPDLSSSSSSSSTPPETRSGGRPATAIDLITDDPELHSKLWQLNKSFGKGYVGGIPSTKTTEGREIYRLSGFTAEQMVKAEEALTRWGEMRKVHWQATGPLAGPAPDVRVAGSVSNRLSAGAPPSISR
ncbi:hypothetical protein CDD83_4982 [Cordyceps sp. RAO-2017]|nr:hypothetical protein CDD83_4982 [Cordyceps sp. RAO-2017]